MNYTLLEASDLTECLSLRCSYQSELGLQLAIQSIGLVSANSAAIQFLNCGTDILTPQLENILFQFIPEIDFASLHMVLTHSVLKRLINPEQLLSRYQIPATTHVFKTLERALRWDDRILTWLATKKIKPHEISFLNLLAEDDVKKLLERAAQSPLSKMDSINILESLSELILMKIEVSLLFAQPWTDKTISIVKDLRYPQSFVFHPIKQINLKWPRSVSSQSKRIQDKMGYQIQFFVSHPDELNQTLSQLEKMNMDWSDQIKEFHS